MLTSIQDLVQYSKRQAAKWPEISSRIEIREPGFSAVEIHELNARMRGLPQSYLSILARLDLRGISIGFFELTPGDLEKIGLAQSLLLNNDSSKSPYARFADRDRTILVAAYEAEPIGVASTTCVTWPTGTMVLYDHENLDSQPAELSRSFEDLLLTAGNLDSIRDKASEDSSSAEAIAEFDRYLQSNNRFFTPQMMQTWRAIAEVILS